MKTENQSASILKAILATGTQLPVEGRGATEFLYSDKKAYEVLSVSKDLKTVCIQRYNAKMINKDWKGIYGQQEYSYEELEGPVIKLTFRNKAYRYPVEQIKEWTKQGHLNCKKFFDENPKASKYNPIEGDVILTTKWNKMNIAFQRREAYHDPHF